MAVSGKTAAPHEVPYFLGTDKPPDMAAVTKAIADKVHSRLENIHPDQLEGGVAGNIIIMEAAGNGDYHSLSGDVTMTKDGVVTIANGAVTSRKYAPTVLQANASGNLATVNALPQDVPGMSFSFTPLVTSKLFLHVSIRKTGAGAGSIRVWKDSALTGPTFQFHPAEGDYSVMFLLEGLTAAEHTIKLQAANTGTAATITGSGETPNPTRMVGELVAE